MDALRPVLARLIGAAVAGLMTYLATRFHIVIPAETQGQISEGVLAGMLTLFSVIYALVHRGVSAKINPTDGASPMAAAKVR